MNTLKDYALRYTDLGWEVAPFHFLVDGHRCSCGDGGCSRIGKHPIGEFDQIVSEIPLSSDLEETFRKRVEAAWTRWPNANIGVRMGDPGGPVVVDANSLRGGLVTFDRWRTENGATEQTYTSVTTAYGGMHYYFRAPEDERPGVESLGAGVSYLGAGDWVLVPPSGSDLGEIYKWNSPIPIHLELMPVWLDDLIHARGERRAAMTAGLQEAIPDVEPDSLDGWDGQVPDFVEAALANGGELARLFKRDKRLAASKKGPDSVDFKLALMLTRSGVTDPTDLAFGLMASRQQDAEAWARLGNNRAEYFAKTANAALEIFQREQLEREDALDGTHPALTNSGFPMNEKGNCDRFLAMHGDDLLFHETEQAWYVWDGKTFSDGLSDENTAGGTGGARKRVQNFLDDLWVLPRSATDPDTQEKLTKFVEKSGTRGMREAILALAQPEQQIHEREFDFEPRVLNCPNGIVDLKTGEVSEHDRRHRCTHIAGAPYAQAVQPGLFHEVLEAALPDREIRNYFQKCWGYSLLGEQPEQVFFFCHGPGATGKSTIIKAIQGALGTYHRAADFSTFLMQRQGRSGGAASPDLARLSRARVVTSTEVGHGQALNDGLIKQISGGDTMLSRGLYQTDKEWRPVMSLWLVANDRPKGRVDDDALWRRLRPFDFSVQVPPEDRDPQLGAKLDAPEVRGEILSWLVMGAQEYLEDGHLAPPQAVLDGVESYKEDSNPCDEFMGECLARGDGKRVKVSTVWEIFRLWCRRNEARVMQKKEFRKVLAAMLDVKKRHGHFEYVGIGVTPKALEMLPLEDRGGVDMALPASETEGLSAVNDTVL